MLPGDWLTWLLVFCRISAVLAIFPIFSSTHYPVQLRVALGAALAFFTSAALPPADLGAAGWGAVVGAFAREVGVGLLLGFVGRMLFYALDTAGGIMSTQMGLMLATDINPFSGARTDAPGMLLNVLAVTLFFSLDLHHAFLLGLQRSFELAPLGAARGSEAVVMDVVSRTSGLFVVAVQIAAPIIAVSFLISLIFSVLGRAVPQMNVFTESFAFRTLTGLIVLGLSLNVMAQHISNYLHRLPEDVLHVAALLGGVR